MLIVTLKAQKRLVSAGADDQLAEALAEIISSAEEQVLAKGDLEKRMQATEERIKKTMCRAGLSGVGILLAALAICTTLIISYG